MNIRSVLLAFLWPLVGVLSFSFGNAEMPAWRIDYQKSKVSFIAEQAGAEFEGHWNDWNAEVRFDPENLDESYAIAEFHVSSMATFDPERDATLLEPEWFDVDSYPIATFEATGFRANSAGRFTAASELEVKGLHTPLLFKFELQQEDDGTRVLKGEAEVDRLSAGLGTGEWLDTTWIGQFVRVKVILYATVPEVSPD